MLRANRVVAVIPSDYFRWRPRVQFRESFTKMAHAIRYARRHGCNLVVECDEGNGPQFDVLDDPWLFRRPAVRSGLADAWKAFVALFR